MTLMRIEKNTDAGIPETMKVVKDGEWYLVQSYREEEGKWITQKGHRNPRTAMQDCVNWYLS